ncbi:Crp/Fnr family transcriptional regulator [Candidatus Methylobacter favarea]|uniref:Crp/Fnr family transcriptional regulator n=1 Tax=Candidatus Methylobacter favarea TaxID=2707345 RepID=A0A8S0WL93_9GAMM|nr:Crp/Fnr family transcriptional regulator [Candidatus Methylobacter favarea]CAA9892470.1 Crp/Fnr family transcriptional regulator [Candidatus Methylobacter favarea]
MPSYNSTHNILLDSLPASEFERLASALELVSLPLGKVLFEPGAELRHVYFPTTCIISKFYIMESGASSEVAVIGKEGVSGVALFMGGGSMPNQAVVQSAGQAYRLSAALVKQEFQRMGEFQRVILRYTMSLITQIAQTAACNRHHSVDQQLCRRLLLSLDRLPSDELVMTQEMIANMLGVRREGVTESAGKLQKAGLIAYRRGHIKVLDRKGLEARVCECYEVVKKESDRLLAPAKSSCTSNVPRIIRKGSGPTVIPLRPRLNSQHLARTQDARGSRFLNSGKTD